MKQIKDELISLLKNPLKLLIIAAIVINITFGMGGALYWFLPSPLKYWAQPIAVIALSLLYRKLYVIKKGK